jgi:hypothetical protein
MSRAYRKVAEYGTHNPFGPQAKSKAMIEVHQRGENGRFRVVYGLQVKEGLTYAEAAREFGECVFHYEACNGRLGNDGP